jgi:SAM-dependent methyltransferase
VGSGADDWDEHWSGFSAAAADNPAQHFRHRLLASLVGPLRPTRLLDIGSGQGDLLVRFAREVPGAALVGLELSAIGVEQTQQKVPHANVLQIDLLEAAARTRLEGISADVAVCCEVLEHLDDPATFLRAAKFALAPGATLFVTVPGGPRSAFDRLIGHRRHYSPGELRVLLEAAGFSVSSAYGAGFPFFNLYRLVVIARGDRLATDVSDGRTGRVATAVMKAFGILLRFTFPRRRWGWQTVAVATPNPLKVAMTG